MHNDRTTAVRARGWKLATCLLAAAVTSGCTATRATIATGQAAPVMVPAGILVVVQPTAGQSERAAASAQHVAGELGPRIVTAFARRNIRAYLTPPPPLAGERRMILYVTIHDSRSGNWFRRTAIGFGLGKPSLYIVADLVSAEQPTAPLQRVEVATRIRARPGLLVSAGLAAATGVVAPLAVVATTTVAIDHDNASKRLSKAAAKMLVERLNVRA